jgi:hypothetical protein
MNSARWRTDAATGCNTDPIIIDCWPGYLAGSTNQLVLTNYKPTTYGIHTKFKAKDDPMTERLQKACEHEFARHIEGCSRTTA